MIDKHEVVPLDWIPVNSGSLAVRLQGQLVKKRIAVSIAANLSSGRNFQQKAVLENINTSFMTHWWVSFEEAIGLTLRW